MKKRYMKMRLGERLDQDLTDWKRVKALTDNHLARAIEEDPDTFEVQAEWLDYAVIVMPARRKERITARFDKDVVDWFKEQGKGYQSRMNAVLRAYYEAQKKKNGRAQPIGVSSNHRHGAYRGMVTLER